MWFYRPKYYIPFQPNLFAYVLIEGGKKRLAMFHPANKVMIEDKANGWVIAEEDR